MIEIRTVLAQTLTQLFVVLLLVGLFLVCAVALLLYCPLLVLPAPRRALAKFVLAVFDVDGYVAAVPGQRAMSLSKGLFAPVEDRRHT